VNALFVLFPAGQELAAFRQALPTQLADGLLALRRREHAPARDREHLRYLMVQGRTLGAMTWVSGMVKALATGAVLGGTVNAVLAGAFGMLGGLVEVAVPLGVGAGAGMGAMSASMRGTEKLRPEVEQLVAGVRPGDTLVVFYERGDAVLRQLHDRAAHAGLACLLLCG
jgi:hypothetical protein